MTVEDMKKIMNSMKENLIIDVPRDTILVILPDQDAIDEAFEEGRQKGASEASVRTLDILIAAFDGYKKKGRDCISIDDVKMELCLAIGRMFRKEAD